MTVSIIVRTSDPRKKWLLTKCKVCAGYGRINQERNQITTEQCKAWGYNSLLCPECGGRGYQKEITYTHKIGEVIND